VSDDTTRKRLFFGFEVDAPWPTHLPNGRVLLEKERHLTTAFLGNVDFSQLESLLENAPAPSFKIGLAGEFDKVVFLPSTNPHVVAYHVSWMENPSALEKDVQTFMHWLKSQGFNPNDPKKFLPHVTVSRSPFDSVSWNQTFQKFPMILRNFHLYESIGNLRYKTLWTYPLLPPFEEIEHTADIAYKIRGETPFQLYIHAFTALAFKFPEIISFRKEYVSIENLDAIIIALNRAISCADSEMGCPFKAVSFHGHIKQEANATLSWEMIVDV